MLDFLVLLLVTGSDHFPIAAVFDQFFYNESNSSSVKTILRWDKNKSTEFADMMCWRNEVGNIHDLDGDEMYENVKNTIYDVCSNLKMWHPKKAAKNKKWFDLDCIESKKTVKSSLRKYRKKGFNENIMKINPNLKTYAEIKSASMITI